MRSWTLLTEEVETCRSFAPVWNGEVVPEPDLNRGAESIPFSGRRCE